MPVKENTTAIKPQTQTQPFTKAKEMIKFKPMCQRAAVLDIDSNRLLFLKGRLNTKTYPASTTKILSAIVALSVCDFDVLHKVGDELDFVQPESSLAEIQQGYTFDMKSLLLGMMLPSGNDAAYSVAACVGKILSDNKTIDNKKAVGLFVEEMNRFAKEIIGTTNSNFTCPDGYPDDNHYTTLEDMLKIAKYAIENEKFMQIVGTADCTVSSISEYDGRDICNLNLSNTNCLIRSDSRYFYPYAHGIKTGTTPEAGNCLVSYAVKDGKRALCCVFNSPEDEIRYTDSLGLLTSALAE